MGIAEQHAVTFAAGMATKGMRPVIPIYSTFLQRAYDQVIHDVATAELAGDVFASIEEDSWLRMGRRTTGCLILRTSGICPTW